MRRRPTPLVTMTWAAMPLAFALALGACPEPSGNTDCPTGWLCFPDGSISDAYLGDLLAGPDLITADVQIDNGPDGGFETQGEVSIEPGAFGAPCNGNVDCNSGWCVESENGFVCTKTCLEDCPDGFDCKSVQTSGADVAFLCVPRVVRFCTPCQADFQCTGGDCATLDGVKRCAPDCATDDDCPNGYTCREDATTELDGFHCLPVGNSCDCTPDFDGGVRTCSDSNADGTCYGVETCEPGTGWGSCSAIAPSVEVCDGMDNDCNLLVDDGVTEGEACTNDNAAGSCAGVTACSGADGIVCVGPTPAAETCDFKDNDCDGLVDEDFKDVDGHWTLQDHCGTCGNACADKIPNGTGVCGGDPSSPICIVESCDADYVKINDFQCSLPPDVSCQPCTADSDCYGGTCTTLDGQSVCVSPCGATDQSCAPGYSCGDVDNADGATVQRCVPDSASCVCNAVTDGQTRTCKIANGTGTCFGEETCDAATGWQGCTAQTPAAEVCDGIDNNCNGAVDDGIVPPTEPCANTNAFGTCTGTWFCTAPTGTGAVAWVCSALVPAEDVCDLQDNDCSGSVDDPFKTGDLYVDDANCGACGIACDGALPNATAQCTANGGQPRCEVVSCDVGYYQAGPLTCLPIAESLCAPCDTDANCQVPGDVCLALDGGNFCGRDCSADNLHGLPEDTCDPGYSCVVVDAAAGVKQCQPDSGSCSCLPGDDGNTRNCVNDNAFGQCFGSQTCNSTLGWSPCTAGVPAAEICDGVDNDCDSLVDNVDGRGAVCDNTNAAGTCVGVLDCIAGGGPDLTCTAATPAVETCDYADNDCDGVVDEDFPVLYDSCSVGTGICQRFGFYECASDGSAEECNAVAATSEAEICNGLDDNCDGDVDEGFPDLGTICTAGSGACQNTGITICDGTGAGTTCSVSGGNNTPEVCDGIDNDCDGESDEDYPGTGQACILGLGSCAQPGTIQCNTAQDGTECDATPLPPGVETCDGLDNDCDGNTDAPLVAQACDNQVGVCAGSTKTCGGLSGWLACQGAEYGPTYEPTELTCDGLDNDCDGDADNGLFAPNCALQEGVCAGSKQVCDGANGWKACDAAEYGVDYQAADEVGQCDGVDNDCDGEVDEDFPLRGTVCQAGVGACAQAGTYVCNPAGTGVVCSATAGAPAPETCNGIDDNCDGQVDNNVTGAPACALTAGVCGGSTRTCVSGSFQACTAAEYGPNYQAGAEFSCDGLDNDCDGSVDDASDLTAPPCSNQNGVCAGALAPCGGGGGFTTSCPVAVYTAHSNSFQSGDESGLCDNMDNDCDGLVDEDFATKGLACAAGVGACAVVGTNVCNSAGTGVVCSATAGPAGTETCNGIDDDCDGDIDNGTWPLCGLQAGVCSGSRQLCAGASGLQACNAGNYGANYQPLELACDGLDNDCDGTADNVDVDGDGQGPVACGGTDCDDLNPLAYLGAPETCGDNRDNDCNGIIDDKNVDNDGYIDALCTAYTGALPVTDCDDNNNAVNPGQDEVCGDSLDNDCDGSVNNRDIDGDNFIDLACGGNDCNDGEADVHPGHLELCDNLDNDCNGAVDDKDLDADGHVDAACAANYVGALPATDCDDTNVGVNPLQFEVCGNALDEDCSGAPDDKDVDADGAFDTDPLCGGDDCNDNDPMIYPGAPEYRDGKDNDCDPDGKSDEGVFAPGEIVITELFYDSSQSPDENYEWFELFNPTARPVNIRTWLMRDDPGTSQEVAVINTDVVVPPRGFVTLCRTGEPDYNGGVTCDYEYGFFQLANSADEIFLEFDGSTPVTVDQVEYDESPWPAAINESLNLDPDSFGANNNAPASWCAHPNGTNFEFGPNADRGTPGTSNVDCSSTTAPAIAAVHPDNVPSAGGTPIRIVGYNFDGSPNVTVGGAACPVVSNTLTGIVCTSPSTSPGLKDIAVSNAGSDTLVGAIQLSGVASSIGAAVIDRPASVRFARDTWSQPVFARVTDTVTGVACPASGEFPSAQLIVEVGYGADGSDPRSAGSWVWFPAFCESAVGPGNEFRGAFTVPAPGTYSVAYRVSTDGGVTWNYVDLNGGAFSPGQMGTATVL